MPFTVRMRSGCCRLAATRNSQVAAHEWRPTRSGCGSISRRGVFHAYVDAGAGGRGWVGRRGRTAIGDSAGTGKGRRRLHRSVQRRRRLAHALAAGEAGTDLRIDVRHLGGVAEPHHHALPGGDHPPGARQRPARAGELHRRVRRARHAGDLAGAGHAQLHRHPECGRRHRRGLDAVGRAVPGRPRTAPGDHESVRSRAPRLGRRRHAASDLQVQQRRQEAAADAGRVGNLRR